MKPFVRWHQPWSPLKHYKFHNIVLETMKESFSLEIAEYEMRSSVIKKNELVSENGRKSMWVRMHVDC